MRSEFDTIRNINLDSRSQLPDKNERSTCDKASVLHSEDSTRSCSSLHLQEVPHQSTFYPSLQSSHSSSQDVLLSHHLNFSALPMSTHSLPSTDDDDTTNQWNLVAGRKSIRNLNNTNPSINKPATSGPTVSNCNIRKIAGSNKSSTSKISSSSLGKWYIFAGHLSKDTSEEDLKDYLESNNINVYEVKKLSPRQPWQEKSSAFKLCINLNCKDTIMNPELWPDQSDIRDWFFKPKQ